MMRRNGILPAQSLRERVSTLPSTHWDAPAAAKRLAGRVLHLFCVGLTGAVAFAADSPPGRFAFGTGQVTGATEYTATRGFGFEPGAAVLDAGGFCTAAQPFFFSVDLPEGDYRVNLTLGDPAGESHTVVRAESRRLMLEPVDTKKGELTTRTFLVHLRTPQIPSGGSVRLKPREIGALHSDRRLTLEFNGARPCVAALEITKAEDAVTVFLAGDSTVTDQQVEPYAAWGQMLPAFFGPTVAVANHAESGESARSFVGERRHDKVMSMLKPGDYLLIQFGHNDQKAGVAHLTEAGGYKDLLRRFVNDARAKGAHPVLVTSMERRNFDSAGKHIVPSLDGYPQATREVGAELDVPVLDLNARSIAFYEALGPEEAKHAFVHFPAGSFPDQAAALADDTHFTSYGAYELAKCVVEEIKARVPALAAHLRPGIPAYDPSHPGRFSDWHLPASPPKPVVKPEGS
jgi:lysophospholipase L1-like esterase